MPSVPWRVGQRVRCVEGDDTDDLETDSIYVIESLPNARSVVVAGSPTRWRRSRFVAVPVAAPLPAPAPTTDAGTPPPPGSTFHTPHQPYHGFTADMVVRFNNLRTAAGAMQIQAMDMGGQYDRVRNYAWAQLARDGATVTGRLTYETRFVANFCGNCGDMDDICYRCQFPRSGRRPAHAGCAVRCQCAPCVSCDQPMIAQSDVCRLCNKHINCSENACACVRCTYCRTPCSATICRGLPELDLPSCGRGTNCCNCSDNVRDRIWLEAPTPPTFHKALKTEHKLNPLTRYVGVEIECSGRSKLKVSGVGQIRGVVKKWGGGIVHDGSVRDGIEITTAPASGDKLVQQLLEIASALNKNKMYADQSAGYHVHVDAGDFSWWDMRKLAALYARIESGLFALVPPSRKAGSYAIPCGGEYMELLNSGLLAPPVKKAEKKAALAAPKKALLGVLYNTHGHREINNTYEDKYGTSGATGDGTRYYALNLHSWAHRGTVEFRLHHGTTQPDKLINWAMVCGSVVATAHREAENILQKWPTGLAGVIALAPTPAVAEWVKMRAAAMRAVVEKSYSKTGGHTLINCIVEPESPSGLAAGRVIADPDADDDDDDGDHDDDSDDGLGLED